MRIYAVRIFVNDWETACRFYEEQLGLPLRFSSIDMGWAEFDIGGPSLALERAAGGSADLVGRFVGVSLIVDDLDATHDRLVRAGVRFTGPPERQPWGGRLAHFQDPEGNVLTLLEY